MSPVGDGVSSPSAAAASLNDPGRSRSGSVLRRGLPRVAGGEPWPPAGAAAAPAITAAAPAPVSEPVEGMIPQTAQVLDAAPATATATAPSGAAAAAPGSALRRGLPRVAGGDPWPPAGTAAAVPTVPVVDRAERDDTQLVTSAATATAAATPPGSAVAPRPDVSAPLPFTRTVWQGVAPRHAAAVAPAPSRLRPTWPQALSGLFAAAGLAILAGAGVALVRAFLSLPFMHDFLAAFPGEYRLPAGTAVGIPGWIGWQHFFNIFLMTLIIRSGLQVRTQKRPTVFWTPHKVAKGKISLTLWFHQALDLLWIVNGAIFVVLLFATGQWVRIVPTSWEVFPNALSALLQYVSFDWPTENGWVNYNSLQQLAYFTIVFLAAPVAIVTGFRMSSVWPKKAESLSKAYPVEWARAVHFPTMLFFSAFIVVHVALVFLTGMLRNLNHMFASQDAVTWTGFWVFVLAMVVVAVGWIAARPLVLAPIARLFGKVSGR
ncbi:cytochrome b/b6 domain-containing protein [Microbacterium sp. ASV81]|uniref:Cytochrome b/b6 domain-containing protein n=1 Tax=Microbacterium capsulatum TaxID=3041921 RepID=A0ABU0XLL0_9MICO|nr:cytochrome b/b6 domain-containing protein [Microbacterium sp. ASV81]MDQ4215722.1 cytochrome b/b6 domain-containing protein [Microbacterium sp. ASV81]